MLSYLKKNSFFKKRFRHDESGSAVIEFAIWGSIIFLMIFGIVEISLILLTQNVMESAIFNAARSGKIGEPHAIAEAIVQERSGMIIDTDKMIFTETDLPTSDGVTPVSYTLEYDWRIFTPIIGQFIGENGSIRLKSETIVQKEPD